MSDVKNKIAPIKEGKETIKKWKQEGNKIVFTNGCFDLIHMGHVDYLEKASQKGTKLVVGLNTDRSVTRLKGESRPIMDEHSRARILASMEFVDLVILFGEDTPYNLISQLSPDILIKGSDYLTENIVGSDIVLKNGGEVLTIDLVKGYSTSSIIEKIKNL